jgi:hypothetical protein
MTLKAMMRGCFATVLSGVLVGVALVSSASAQQSPASAADALQKAHVVDRLADGMSAERSKTAPGFVLDPAWPQPLPHHWVIADVGGIAGRDFWHRELLNRSEAIVPVRRRPEQRCGLRH